MKAVLLALVVIGGVVAFAPSAEAVNYCDFRTYCPGIVCYGTGSHHGYLVCVGPGYCDPGPCEWLP